MEKLLNTGFMFSEKNVLRGLMSSFLFSPQVLWAERMCLCPSCMLTVIMVPTNGFVVGQCSIGNTSAVHRMGMVGPCLRLFISFDAGSAVLLWFLKRLMACCR